MTQFLPATSTAISQAADLLRDGQAVAFPTETVYGLGADALRPEAVLRIFAAKGRPADNPLIVHVAEVADVEPLVARIDARARLLMERFWPGPLTLVLPKAARVPNQVTAGLDTVAVRLPAHPVALALIREASRPIAAPSANRSGRPSPTTARHVYEDMNGRIPMILDGGACAVGVESTVLDLTEEMAVVLRPGGVTLEALRELLGEVRVDAAALAPLKKEIAPRSPGMKYKHYAPDATVVIVSGTEEGRAVLASRLYDEAKVAGERAVILAPAEQRCAYGPRVFRALGRSGKPGEAAAQLFAALRELDAQGFQRIIAEAVEAEGIGLAVMNRLCRAANFAIEHAD
ncbi:MAG: L-threonylcarbamoyladenylate synthase [Clostridia bacterium]|nr:L-threonylcarbamoyladenylate synthase [Clostridia bacterium]